MNQPRKSYEPTPYAALRGEELSVTPPAPQVSTAPAALVPQHTGQEAKRLSELRQALWIAFEAGGPLPMPLIELTHAYTAALRLELSLKAPPRPAMVGSQRSALAAGRRD